MSLNAGLLHELEALGLSNAALEQLALLLRLQLNGSVTWHVLGGLLTKFDVRYCGSLRSAKELAQVEERLVRLKPRPGR